MTEEYFKEHALKCKVCGSTPELVEEVKGGFWGGKADENSTRYRVYCYDCDYNCGSGTRTTRRNKTPYGALKSWNKHFGLKEGE